MSSKQNPPATAPTKHYTHWIHCNICYSRYNKKERRVYLLACKHISCEQCLVELEVTYNGPQIYKCPVCHEKTRACEINNTMPKHLKELFHPEPFTDIPNSFQILLFQVKHRERYREYLERQNAALVETQKEIKKAKEEAQKTYQEYEEIKAERKHLENRVRIIRQQRRDIDDNRSNKSVSSSSSSSSTGTRQKLVNQNDGGMSITTFSNLSPKTSFIL